MITEMTALDRQLRIRVDELVGQAIPVNIERIATDVGIAAIEQRLMSVDGYLGRRDDGRLVIRVQAGSNLARRRFTIAHEIGHVLLASSQGQIITQPVARGIIHNSDEEKWANRIAAELLMPEQSIRGELRATVSSWRLLREIAAKYQVSLTALTRRLCELPRVAAIEMRISRKGAFPDGSKVQIWHSTWARCLFSRDPRAEGDRVLAESPLSSNHEFKVELDGDQFALKCHGRRVTLPGAAEEYRVVGWKVLD